MLITNLVGLHTLDVSAVTTAPSELRTAWSPRSKTKSVDRTRTFTMHSFLGWAVDSIDMYASLLYRKPNFLQEPGVCSAMDGAGRSVWKKVHRLSEHFEVSSSTTALIDVMITWRNNVFHELADNTICETCMEALDAHASQIASTYRGLDPTHLPEKASSGEPLTFKETASMINAAHAFVREVDEAVLDRLDLDLLCSGLVADKLREDSGFRSKYFCLPPQKRQRFIGNWLVNEYGMSEVGAPILARCAQLPSPSAQQSGHA